MALPSAQGLQGRPGGVVVAADGLTECLRTRGTWLKRRQAIEPLIGHAKADHRMDRCWLKGPDGDALHAVLCAAGFNIRWLLRAIARLGLPSFLLALFGLVLYGGNRVWPNEQLAFDATA